jgi:hypothetical protein
MREVLNGGCLHRDGDLCLTDLLQHEFKDVLTVFQAQTVAQDLPQEDFGHVTQDDLMFSHKRFEQDLIDFVVWTPIIANDVVCDCFDKFLVKVVVGSPVLQIRVGVSDQTFGVIDLHVRVIGSEHI